MAVTADIHTLYSSDFYRILDFKCRCMDCSTSKPEYSNSFCISFVRKGNFLFNVFRRSLDSYNGCVLITKPGYERTVTHIHTIPDECTILDFRKDFYPQLLDQYGKNKFFQDNDLHSTLLKTSAELEFLHFYILELIQVKGSKLQIDNLVLELIGRTLPYITDYKPDNTITASLKKNHLGTIERAKEYIINHFTDDISLMEIAAWCHVSPFHFSRLFKKFTREAPHQFLLNMRLNQARMYLLNTDMPVADIGYSSGFNSVEYFTAAFRRKYNLPPASFRKSRSSLQNSKIS